MTKSFTITVVPCLAGSAFGYIAHWRHYQFWAKTRQEVIKDMLIRISIDLKIK